MEGLKLYENMVEAKEVSQLVSLVNNLRTAGRRGQLQSKNPFLCTENIIYNWFFNSLIHVMMSHR